MDNNTHYPVAWPKFIVVTGNELDEGSLRAMPTPASKIEEWVSLLKL